MNKTEIKNIIGKKDSIIFEIGAADGGDTQQFLNEFSDVSSRFFCFEPEPTNIVRFVDRKFPNNVELFKGVVSNINGIITFNRSADQNFEDALRYSGSIKKPKEHLKEWPHIVFKDQIEVNSITLDTFCKNKNINLIDFIWADVQGAEEDIILGGKEMFKDKVRFLYTEYSNIEYYEGQKNLDYILNLLGPNWSLVQDFRTDALFKNNLLD